MYNFYPGPSKIHEVVQGFAQDAFNSGILEKNHRSKDFMVLLEECLRLFKAHLNIPENYKVFFTSSATECWEIYAQSFSKDNPLFYYNGAFGQKWMEYTAKIKPRTEGVKYNINEIIPLGDKEKRDICFVANETSNATQVSPETIKKNKLEDGLLVLDVVSSLGGVNYEIADADIWISSSQKCFGLPSGMGIMIVSPKALQRAKEIGDRKYYNSALFIEDNFDKFQTPYTPNILAVYLLKRLLEVLPNIKEVSNAISKRMERITTQIVEKTGYELLVSNSQVRSQTLLALKCGDPSGLDKKLKESDVWIGKGYGEWKENTFRIANFPAISDSDYNFLINLLANNSNY